MKKVLVFFLSLLAAGHGFAQLAITAVSPSQADPGTTGLTVTFTLPNSTPPTPPVSISPDNVTIGSLVGTSVSRPSLDTVTAVFNIPADEAVGAKDCTITFTTPMGSTVFTKTGGFTVGSASSVNAYTNGPPAAGYNLFSPNTSTNTYLMDNNENIVRTWSSSYNPGQSIYLLDDGSLLRTANTSSTNFNTGGCAGRVEQYDWDGNMTWAYDYDTTEYRSHHDVKMLPNGHLLMIAWEKKTQTEAEAAGRNPTLLKDGELWPDSIIEVAPTGSYGGTIVWEWHAWDHLVQDYSSSDSNYGVVADHPELIDLNYAQGAGGSDWLHINAVDYNAELDQILVSVHNFSEVWIIDHSTTTAEAASHSGGSSGKGGDLLYRWGNPAAYDSGTSSDQQLFVQHNAQWIADGLPGAGDILIFNNGQGRPDGDYSSVDEIVPPVALDGSYTNGLPLAAVWTYTNSVATNFYASHISGAQRQKNGNTLICEGTSAYAFEVTSEGGLVWDYTASGEMFRFERYSPAFAGFDNTELALPTVPYAVVDTHQTSFYDNSSEISAPGTNDAFYGQDASYASHQPCYEVSPDRETVYDYNTKLTWTRSPDWNGDGTIDINDKMTQAEAAAYVDTLNAANFGGYSDWRLPTIKEVYSLMDFRGTDPMNDDTSTMEPFINPDYFEYAWGDTNANERTIDSQVASSTLHVDPVMGGGVQTMPGINIVDGRIKSYPVTKEFLVYLCRGNTSYGVNNYQDNGDGTVTDHATGMMWAQDDSGYGMLWADALDFAQQMNVSNYLGHSDWRLPNAKELQSIVDYSRAPTATGSAAIDPIFNCTTITNEGGAVDWPWYFTGTTHLQQGGSAAHAVYVCFGRAMGYFNNAWEDVHGAGAQRSESKEYNTTGYTYITDGWYFTNSPQGDAARWYNFVRLVRDADPASASPVYDGIIYVDGAATGSGNGTTWANACTNLQDALDVVTTQSIWIAEGTYTNGSTYSLSNDTVVLLGGFTNGMTSADQRDPDLHPIVFDGLGEQHRILGLNCADVELDGFTITNAQTTVDIGTAGLQITGATNVVMRNMVVSGCKSSNENTSFYGLAAHVTGSGSGSVVMENCSFSDNKTGRNNGAYGLGLNVDGFEQAAISACRFENNTKGIAYGEVFGGGLYLNDIDVATVSNTVFSGNGGEPYHGVAVGGALCIDDVMDSTVIDCTFTSNYFARGNSSLTLGGVALGVMNSTAAVTVERCIFTDNEYRFANGNGAAVFGVAGAAVTLMDCLMTGNDADYGGAAYLNAGSTLLNCTVVSNSAGVSGGGVYCNGGAISNSIVYGNALTNGAVDNVYDQGGTYGFTSSTPLLSGDGNIDSDPLLSGYTLSTNSPCINAGQNALWMDGALDLAGNARVYGQRVDMGAYECTDASVPSADADNDGLGDWDELATYGSDPSLSDSDGDGSSDGDEVFIGSDLLSASSVFKVGIASDGSGDVQIDWPIFNTGLRYNLYGCTNLVEGNWFFVDTTTSSNLMNSTTIDAMFYRVDVTGNN